MDKIPAWVWSMIPVCGLAAGGFMHFSALEQRVVDQGKQIEHLTDLFAQLLNAILLVLGGT